MTNETCGNGLPTFDYMARKCLLEVDKTESICFLAMFPEGGKTRKHYFQAMFPEGGQTRKHCFPAMFPEGGQTRKHCLLDLY